MRSLLIGNGLNLTNYEENSFLRTDNIYIRYINNLKIYWDIINELVLLIETDVEEVIKQLDAKDGIEKLAGITFQYLYERIIQKRVFSWNDAYRLVEILGEISMKSIFFKDNKFLIPRIADEYKNKIQKSYNNIFTLNYIEDWDKSGVVKYLHGNLKKYVDTYCDIGSYVLSHNKNYSEFKTNEYKKINFKDIVFMPINEIVNKYNYIVEGLYPRENLYPAEDLFPYSGRNIYEELDKVENIDIFGMSPYGDDSIINIIKNIKNKKIYVYKLNENEINKWKSYGIEKCFVDSSKFLDN